MTYVRLLIITRFLDLCQIFEVLKEVMLHQCYTPETFICIHVHSNISVFIPKWCILMSYYYGTTLTTRLSYNACRCYIVLMTLQW